MNVIVVVETFVAFIIAITLHEAAHAGMARVLGDSTAVSQGRLSLAPRRQMTAAGTLVAIFLSFTTLAGLGWGKPMDINAQRMRVGPNFGTIVVALAGPALNALLGVAVAIGLYLSPGAPTLAAHWPGCFNSAVSTHGLGLQSCLSAVQPGYLLRLEQFGFVFAVTNIVLALVNLLPVHPLDGYHVVFALLPSRAAVTYRNWTTYMELSLLILFLALPLLLAALGAGGFNPGMWFAGWANNIVNAITGGAYAFYPLL
ncbi:MAG: site-2 protease family protein [Ktedonobacterales bacterium]|nr:site-2 protease family protein [Ktedonobacterales bacterium]